MSHGIDQGSHGLANLSVIQSCLGDIRGGIDKAVVRYLYMQSLLEVTLRVSENEVASSLALQKLLLDVRISLHG